MKLIIDKDVESKGDALDYLREVIREINYGYVVGEGWDLQGGDADDSEDESEEEDTEGDGNEAKPAAGEAKAPEEGTDTTEASTEAPASPQGQPEGVETVEKAPEGTKTPWGEPLQDKKDGE